MMADLPKEPIFFRDEHRAFLETRDADVLDWGVMRLNLYRLKTGTLIPHNGFKWPITILIGISGFAFGGTLIPFMTLATIQVVWQVVTHGLPHWRLIIYNIGIGICFFIPMWLGGIAGAWAFKEAILMAWWTDSRIYNLLRQTVQEGQLIRGYIECSQREKKLLISEIIYRFTSPTGESIEGSFYPDPDSYSALAYEPGTPVWVLYLNDEISVLL